LLFFAEGALLSGVASVLGFVLAAAAVRWLVAVGLAGIPRLSDVRIDGASVVFTVAIAALVTAICSVLPALRVGFNRSSVSLREGARAGTASHNQHRLRGALVAARIASSLVVLAGAGLLIRTFERLTAVRPGFDPAHVSTHWISLPEARYKSDTSVVRFYAQLVDRVREVPGVTAVGLTSRLPLENHGINQNPLYPEDDASYNSKLPPLQLFTAVNADYFTAMNIPLLAGRTFQPMGVQRFEEAIISRSAALEFWKDSTGVSALGKRFRPFPTGRLYTIIGVVADIRDTALAAPPSQVVYFPETFEAGGVPKRTRRTMAVVVRTNEGTASGAAVQQAVRDVDPTLPVFDARR
jgi:putative ABC transport system permease protein